MTPLCEIARKHGTDKGGEHFKAGDTCHTYTVAYWNLFKDQRDNVKRLLEVGVNYGCSLRLWEEFFPSAEIVGLDYNQSSLFTAGRIKCFYADQSNRDSLLRAMSEAGGEFDIIVDDGSHELDHQILTANTLLPFLAPGGVFIIEDILYDCTPSTVTDHIPLLTRPEYRLEIIPCPDGLGRAKCECPKCQHSTPEQLIVIHRAR